MANRFIASLPESSTGSEAKIEFTTPSKKRRISEFDLPIEFHKDSIRTWVIAGKVGKELWRQLKRVMDTKRHSSFQAVNQKILLKVLTSRGNFNYVREIAALRLEADTLNQLKEYNKGSSCVFSHELHFAKSLFSWCQTDFLKRRQEDLAWIGVLEVTYSEDCLTALKFMLDLREVLRHVTLIFDHLLPLPENIGLEELIKMLDKEENDLHMEEVLKEKLESSSRAYETTVRRRMASMRASDGGRRRIYLKKKTMDYEMVDTIETRFKLRLLKDKEEQSNCLAKKTADDLEREIDAYLQEMDDMEYIHSCNMIVHRREIKLYNAMVPDYTTKYDTKFQEIEDKIALTRISMENLKSQREFYEEEIIRFHKEIEEFFAQQILDEEEEEAKRILLEQQRLQKLKKKQMAEKAKRRQSNMSNLSNKSK